jgi:hypothetical protein
MVKKQENGTTIHEGNIISTLHIQGTNNKKYEETRNVDPQLKTIVTVPHTAFAEKHGLHTSL